LAHCLTFSNRVDYCNSILHRVDAVHLRPFQSVLNAATRLVVRKRKFDRITSTLRDNLHWLPVDKRIEFKLCLLVFKCQHQMAPPYLASMCVQLSADTRSRRLRSAAPLYIQRKWKVICVPVVLPASTSANKPAEGNQRFHLRTESL